MAGKGSTVGKAIVVIDDDETQSGATKGLTSPECTLQQLNIYIRQHSSALKPASLLPSSFRICSAEALKDRQFGGSSANWSESL